MDIGRRRQLSNTCHSKTETGILFCDPLQISGGKRLGRLCNPLLLPAAAAWFSHPSLSVLKCDGFFNELAQGPLHKA
ncbi:hypothetical protein C3B79_3771 [Aeromonas hydrophila]|nr:hypothetical protein C3B79_3771 [Aeromonas hydrophila]